MSDYVVSNWRRKLCIICRLAIARLPEMSYSQHEPLRGPADPRAYRMHELKQLPKRHYDRLVSPELDLQRPISLPMFLYRASGSARFDHLSDWSEPVIYPELQGGIKGRSYDELLQAVGLELTFSKISQGTD